MNRETNAVENPHINKKLLASLYSQAPNKISAGIGKDGQPLLTNIIKPVTHRLGDRLNINLCLAIDEDYNIAIDGKLPWGTVEKDLDHFRHWLQWQDAIIVGAKTYEQLFRFKELKDKFVVVITSDDEMHDIETIGSLKGRVRAHDPVDAMVKIIHKFYTARKFKCVRHFVEVGICGGASLYDYFTPIATTIDVTRVSGDFPREGETYTKVRLLKTLMESDHDTMTFSKLETKNKTGVPIYLANRKYKLRTRCSSIHVEMERPYHVKGEYYHPSNKEKMSYYDIMGLPFVKDAVTFEGVDLTGKTTMSKTMLNVWKAWHKGDKDEIDHIVDEFVKTGNAGMLFSFFRDRAIHVRDERPTYLHISFPPKTQEVLDLFDNKEGLSSKEIFAKMIDINQRHLYETVAKHIKEYGLTDPKREGIYIVTDRSVLSGLVYQFVEKLDINEMTYVEAREKTKSFIENMLSAINMSNVPVPNTLIVMDAQTDARMWRYHQRENTPTQTYISDMDLYTILNHTVFKDMYAAAMYVYGNWGKQLCRIFETNLQEKLNGCNVKFSHNGNSVFAYDTTNTLPVVIE